MKAKDLRVGNLVAYSNYGSATVFEVLEIHSNSVWMKDTYNNWMSVDLKSVKPIPLTEQILIDLGYIKLDYDGYGDVAFYKSNEESPLVNISYKLEDKCFYVIIDDYSYYRINIEYLHQLQNLYYSLTGNELK